MMSFSEILAIEGSRCEAEGAYVFLENECWTVLNAQNDEEEVTASAIVVFDLSDTPRYRIVHQFEDHIVDYFAISRSQHIFVDIAANIKFLVQHEVRSVKFNMGDSLNGLFQLSSDELISYGDDGLLYKIRDNRKTLIETKFTQDLRCGFSPSEDLAYIAGDRGTLLRLDKGIISSIDVRGNYSISALFADADGKIMAGCEDSYAFILENDELNEIHGDVANIQSINKFRGCEYWGDDEFGVFERKGRQLVPRFETGLAFKITSDDAIMVVEAGCWIYFFDGIEWAQYQINPSLDKLIEKIPLDFSA